MITLLLANTIIFGFFGFFFSLFGSNVQSRVLGITQLIMMAWNIMLLTSIL